MSVVSDNLGWMLRRASIALAAAVMFATGARAGDATPRGEPASTTDGAAAAATPIKSSRKAGRLSGLASGKLLSDVVERMGRGPDRTEQGGACGGIVLHDWHDENLRVITLGDSVQSIAPLQSESGGR